MTRTPGNDKTPETPDKDDNSGVDEAVEEDVEHGTVSWMVYWRYVTAGAGTVIFAMLYFIFALPAQVM